MPRITAKEFEQKKIALNDIVLDLFYKIGWDELTYNVVAQAAGVRRSTIQNYYKTKNDFSIALQGRVFPYFISLLDFSSIESFKKTWHQSLKDEKFSYILKMLIRNALDENTSHLSIAGLKRLINLMATKMSVTEEEATNLLELMLGSTVLSLSSVI